ncbi:MAG: extracellular solute-binding protein [Ardenticatenaceae bacterium]|nr:extracellular solute-binding protein [Ardenticatenaceae bacterium]MCB9446120.1 extracellular solute-binding protein [Ardenticatenaceae bacterium]
MKKLLLKQKFVLPCSPAPLLLILLLLAFAATSCQALGTPPRLATATAQAQLPPTATPEPLILAAPEGSAALSEPETTPAVGPNPSLTVWVNETSAAHEAMLNQMVADFSRTYQIDVELMLVRPQLLPKLMETAVLSDTFELPDIVLHPVEYTMGWAERGIWDTAVTNEIIDEIGRDTFNPAALDLVTQDGQAAAIPSDGYPQLLIYRTDWAQELGLEPPDNYDAMLTMAQTISSTVDLISGFVIPTESNLATTHQAFEQIALANGCQLIDEKGEVLILEPVCQEAIDFYYNIVHNYSPIGVQTDTSARNAYLDGRTGLIMSSPAILPRLAGLDAAAMPTCPDCSDPAFLAQNSGILTQITGSGAQARPANLSEITYLGIVNGADRETAVTFARYWFNEAYPNWLAVESERKIPMRWGTVDQPRQFIDAWGSQPLVTGGPSLRDLYGDSIVDQLRDSVLPADRWGLPQGHGDLVTALYEDLTISVTLQEMLSGYFDSAQTLREAYAKIIDFIPNYAYDSGEAGGE